MPMLSDILSPLRFNDAESCSCPSILFVDDEDLVLASFVRILKMRCPTWTVRYCASVRAALNILLEQEIDVLVADVKMPNESGFNLLLEMRQTECMSHVPVIMLTGLDDADLKRRALDCGAEDLLTKPIEADNLIARLRSTLRAKEQRDALQQQNRLIAEHNRKLEEAVVGRTRDLIALRSNLISRLAKAAGVRNQETGAHQLRVGRLSQLLAEAMGAPAEFAETMKLASPLHDIGKIGIPDAVLLKPGPLTSNEWQVMKGHCSVGAQILYDGPLESLGCLGSADGQSLLTKSALIALRHHERWDGSGYPCGIAGESIPIEARIVALADAYDTICSMRPYKSALTHEEAVNLIASDSGSHFDPEVHEAFSRTHAALHEARLESPD